MNFKTICTYIVNLKVETCAGEIWNNNKTYPVVVRAIGPPPKGLRNLWQKHTAAAAAAAAALASRNSWWKTGAGPPGGAEPATPRVDPLLPACTALGPTEPVWPPECWPGTAVVMPRVEAVFEAILYIFCIIDTSLHYIGQSLAFCCFFSCAVEAGSFSSSEPLMNLKLIWMKLTPTENCG